MGAVICIAIIAFLFLIMSAALFTGKGSWLIAGFSTISAEKKSAYDKKKLCRAIGVLCFIVFILLCVMACLGYQIEMGAMTEDVMTPFGIIFVISLTVTIVLVTRYINTRCKKNN